MTLTPIGIDWRSRTLLFFAGLFCLSAFYLSTLQRRLVEEDEIIFADYYSHGRILLYKDICPPGHPILESSYGWGLAPVFEIIIKTSLHAFGVSIFSIRLAPCMGVLCALVLFCLAMSRAFGRWAYLFLLLGLTQLSFNVAHSARPEGLTLCVAMINFFWVLNPAGPLLAFVAGVSFGLAGGIQPVIVIYVVPMLVAMTVAYRSQTIDRKTLAFWGLGALVGAVVVFYFADFEQFFIYSSGSYGLSKRFHLPALTYGENLIELVDTGIEKLLIPTKRAWINPLWSTAWALFMVGLASCVMALRQLSLSQKIITLITGSLLLSYLFLNGSPTSVYQVHLFPWFAACTAMFLKDLYQRRAFTNNQITTLTLIFFYVITKSTFMPLLILSTPIVIRILGSFIFTRAGIIAVIGLIVIAIYNIAGLSYAYYFLHRYAVLHPLRMLAVALWPWLFIRTESGSWRLRFLPNLITTRFVFWTLMIFLIVWAGYELKGLSKQQLISNKFNDQTKRIVDNLEKEPRILGPGTVWIQRPNLNLRNSIILPVPMTPPLDPIYAFEMYRPTKAYWPFDAVDGLKKINQTHGVEIFSFGSELETPREKWIEVICHYDRLNWKQNAGL